MKNIRTNQPCDMNRLNKYLPFNLLESTFAEKIIFDVVLIEIQMLTLSIQIQEKYFR